MGIFSGLFWGLTGSAYAAGGLFKESVKSQNHQYSDIVHDFDWYQEHALELNHDRQKELFQLYKNNLEEFEALSDFAESDWRGSYEYKRYLEVGMRWNGYFELAAKRIASKELWLFDDDFRLNENRKHIATDKAQKLMSEHIQFVKEIRKKYEESPDASHTPYIGNNHHWWIENNDTGFYANLENFPWVCEERVWMFGQEKTDYLSPNVAPKVSLHRRDDNSPEFVPNDKGWRIFPSRAREDLHTKEGTKLCLLDDSNNIVNVELRSDGFFWCGEKKTKMKISYSNADFFTSNHLCYHEHRPERLYGTNALGIRAVIELVVAPYEDKNGKLIETEEVGNYIISVGFPVVKFRKLQFNPAFEAQIRALVSAVWLGWPQDTEELLSYCKRAGSADWLESLISRRNKKLLATSLPDDDTVNIINIIIRIIMEDHGYVPHIADKKIINKELARRKKTHENPTKLSEWSNLVFDLVNGEEHIRAEKPGHYEKLLQKFKDITGRDFTRGEDYFDMFQRLAIEDGWYIPDTNKAWFKNPAPPEEEYGCAELPTRYQ